MGLPPVEQQLRASGRARAHRRHLQCATTDDLWETQDVSPEEELAEHGGALGYTGHPGNPPQLDVLMPETDIVTVQIGGNDIGFSTLARTCGEGAVSGVGCRKAVDEQQPFDRIVRTAPKIRAVLDEIHRRSPDAEVFVLGYSGIFKIGPLAGCAAMGVGEDGAQYLRSIHEALNAMIRSVAEEPARSYSAVTTYVDVYGPSAGHTACDLPAIRWVGADRAGERGSADPSQPRRE